MISSLVHRSGWARNLGLHRYSKAGYDGQDMALPREPKRMVYDRRGKKGGMEARGSAG